jgi:hypothetical protein
MLVSILLPSLVIRLLIFIATYSHSFKNLQFTNIRNLITKILFPTFEERQNSSLAYDDFYYFKIHQAELELCSSSNEKNI